MKHILINLLFGLIITLSHAQEAVGKRIQAGLIAELGAGMVEMGTNKLENDGLGIDLSIGANINFPITETIGFNTGLEIDFTTLQFKTSNEPVYYNFNDQNVLSKESAEASANDKIYLLETRKQKPVFLTIPTMMIFRTKYIGYLRYFGKFGLRTSFLASNKTEDTGYEFPSSTSNPVADDGLKVNRSMENMKPKNEMWFIKSLAGFAGGTEWNFTGTTTLMAEIGFYFGFTELFYNRNTEKSDSKNTLYYTNDAGDEATYFSNQAMYNQLRFKLSILF